MSNCRKKQAIPFCGITFLKIKQVQLAGIIETIWRRFVRNIPDIECRGREVNTPALYSGSNIGSETGYPEWGFPWISSDPLGGWRNSTLNWATTAFFHTVFNPLFTNHRIIRCCTEWSFYLWTLLYTECHVCLLRMCIRRVTSETLVNSNQTTRRNNPEDSHLYLTVC
jgi:hypothetical protein